VRVALGLSYNGQQYLGWQSQPSGNTVQDHLEAALARFCGMDGGMGSAQGRVTTLCAGRTDAGVHALQQVVHFDTPLQRDPWNWVRGCNALLPRDIAVQWAQEMPYAFHCRASATARRYAYVLLDSPVRPSVEAGRVGWVFQPLALPPMLEAAQMLLGKQDFSSFRASSCQALSPVKTMLAADIRQKGRYWTFEFEANAFLHHMIRNIMGCLIAVGQGKQPPSWVRDVIAARSRDAAAPTFSPDGLYFLGPRYGAEWGLPNLGTPAAAPAYDWLP
jgi:tRNA pseudouridine38-40 synthase